MKISNYKSSLIILSIFAVLSVTALAEGKRSPQYGECMDAVDYGAFKNTQWASCGEQELKLQDATLNSEYAKLRKSLSPEQRELLIKGQKSWLKYREDWCRFDEQGPSAPGGIAGYVFCLLEITDKQIDLIKDLQF
ncbi:MAG: lysozyme inhibitor LprI family protein [Sulfuricurvum sp.]|uniref:lysozyme inhibitor LprI family protein n=1 Tax=Sulfuricurvum sp. TaxID=2025608 RepID=UPI0026055EE7|nr:lysozyme inhibitor LprI family protein [Sulfuricurvum sp.]MDD2830527.1 lysozyme inhibitor LprI family protein [Sulfuricurvum sp.]